MSEKAIVKYEPKQPVRSAGTLKQLLDLQRDSLASQLPKHIRAETLVRSALLAVQKNHALLKCSQESFFGALMDSARLGLAVGGGGPASEAHLVPFGNEVVLIPDYRGLVKLARQSNEVGRVEAEAVYSNDHFDYKKGINPVCEFAPAKGDRGELECFYMLVMSKDDSTVLAQDYMTVADVEKVRKSAKSKDSPMWKQWFSEGGKKTVLRRGLKLAPMSAENRALVEALEMADREFEFGPTVVDVTDESKTAQLRKRLAGAAEPEPKPEKEEKEAGPTSLTPEEIRKIQEMCEQEPVVPVDDLEASFRVKKLSDLTFPEGIDGFAQVRLELRDLKKAAAEAARD